MTTPLFIGGLGPVELGLVALVLVLLFGASKLPEVARSVGSATGEFKKGREEVEEELEEMRGEQSAGEPATEPSGEAPTESATEPEPEADRTNA